MRIGLVLSNYGGVLGPLKILTAFGLGAAFGDGKQGQSWIHISDVVGVFLKACNEQWEGVFNLVAPNPVSQTYFIKALAKALNRPYFLPPIPKILLKILVGKMSSLVLDSHWVSAQKVIGKKYKFLYPEINTAMKNMKLPEFLQDRVREFMFNTHSNLDYQEELNQFLKIISPSLRVEV